MVIKKDGNTESYDRHKIEQGILQACYKRHVTAETIEKAADSWRAFSVDVLHYRKQTGVTLNEMAEKLYSAASYEQDAINSIKKDFLKKHKNL